jgi:hypothetical protein
MATLSLAEPSPNPTAIDIDLRWQSPTLREWLAGDWGMLFSHPEDFQDRSLEQDRWLTIVREEFHACGVKPLACATRVARRDASWVGAVIADWRTLHIDGAVADLPARQLRAEIAALHSRFVLLVDANLRRRAALPYQPGRAQLSPLDLAASVSALRRRAPAATARQAARAA